MFVGSVLFDGGYACLCCMSNIHKSAGFVCPFILSSKVAFQVVWRVGVIYAPIVASELGLSVLSNHQKFQAQWVWRVKFT